MYEGNNFYIRQGHQDIRPPTADQLFSHDKVAPILIRTI